MIEFKFILFYQRFADFDLDPFLLDLPMPGNYCSCFSATGPILIRRLPLGQSYRLGKRFQSMVNQIS